MNRADKLPPSMSDAQERGPGGKGKAEAHTFERKTFRTSRLAEFASEGELSKQTGQPVKNWPLVVVKEVADNGIDETERAGVAPEIAITVADDAIAVADNGRGIAPATVKKLTDYDFRTSSNAAYVRRGAEAQRTLETELARLNAEPVDVPVDLERRVRTYLAEHPEATWDAAVRAVVEEDEDEDDEIGDRS